MSTIYFATNRKLNPASAGADFLDVAATAPPATPRAEDLLCAVAQVSGIDIKNADAGTIAPVDPDGLNRGGFSEAQLAPLLASTNDILVFVHGADNSFSDAITRAAYNQAWLAAGQGKGSHRIFDMIVFTWPGRCYSDANFLGEANPIGDLADYRHDQEQARRSDFHLALFLRQTSALRRRIGNRRLHLLCHSMGNYALAGAVEFLFSGRDAPPPARIFDEIILAAADERADGFFLPDDRRLSDLWRLGHEITVYSNRNDVLMTASHWVNGNYRLGYDGPPNKANTGFFSPSVYDFVDCTGIDDSFGHGLLDSHQYYRESPKVRADILGVLAGLDGPGLTGRDRDAKRNVYTLFPPDNMVASLSAPTAGRPSV
jgi:esterase/lipase superfamily enzyme